MNNIINRYISIFIATMLTIASAIFLCGAKLFETDGILNFSSTQTISSTSSETVSFTSREEEYITTVNGVPLYSPNSSLSNSCGATAGAVVIGFYDKYYEDLIDGYVGYLTKSGTYKSNDSTYIPSLMEELYTLMKINVDGDGVTESNCLNGLTEYIEDKNYSVEYTSVLSSGKLSESKYKSAINANYPIILFCGETDLYNFSTGTSSETISISNVSENHIYIGYGYKKVYYYNANGNFRTDVYMQVACCLTGWDTAYLKISSTVSTISQSWLENGYSIDIS